MINKMATAVGGSEEDGYMDDEQQSLEEFIATHTLPQCVAVTRGSYLSPTVVIERGDVLLLRHFFPSQVALTFVDDGARREVYVSPDVPVLFHVLPPKDGASSDPLEGQSNIGYRPISMVTYPTVADLLMDCPTYFEANAPYEDPYLPGFSIKPGDKFRFVKPVKDSRHGSDGTRSDAERLQCRTESGELVCLSPQCRGNFTILKDDRKYTLRELVDLAKVPRRLKLAPGNDESDFELDSTALKASASTGDGVIPDLPMTFTGVICMSKPESRVDMSPFDNLDTQWIVSAKANLYVKPYSASDYEEPVMKKKVRPQHIASFVTEHEQNFPAQASLLSYINPPDVIAECLKDCKEVIVHEAVKTPKLFIKDADKDVYFCISETEDISFVEIPKTLNSIFQMMALPLGSEVRVLADVAADFPWPFVLRYGDILRVTKHDSASWKYKHSSTGDVPIIKCERIVEGKKEEKLKLPLDLEVNLIVQIDPNRMRVIKLVDIILGRELIPSGKVSILEGNGSSYANLPANLQLLQVLKDTELVVSPLDTTVAISPVVKSCAHVPVRHQAMLAFKRKLEFPDGYFVMPTIHQRLSIEPVREEDFEELERAKKLATEYEDFSFGGGKEEKGKSGKDEKGKCGKDEKGKSGTSCKGYLDEDDRSRRGRGSTRTLNSTTSEESLSKADHKGPHKRAKSKERLRRLSRGLNPKNWRSKSDKAEAQPEPRVPVSGLLTLSLQPHQAQSNEYLSEVPQSPPACTQAHSHVNPEDEDPYEDVVISQHPHAAKSKSLETSPKTLQGAASDYKLSERVWPIETSSSAAELNMMSEAAAKQSKSGREGNRFATVGPSYLRKAKTMFGNKMEGARSMFDRQIEDMKPKFKKKFRSGRPSQNFDARSESSEEPPSPQQRKASKEKGFYIGKDSSERFEKCSDTMSVESHSSGSSDNSRQNHSFDSRSLDVPIKPNPVPVSPVPKPTPRRLVNVDQTQKQLNDKDGSMKSEESELALETYSRSPEFARRFNSLPRTRTENNQNRQPSDGADDSSQPRLGRQAPVSPTRRPPDRPLEDSSQTTLEKTAPVSLTRRQPDRTLDDTSQTTLDKTAPDSPARMQSDRTLEDTSQTKLEKRAPVSPTRRQPDRALEDTSQAVLEKPVSSSRVKPSIPQRPRRKIDSVPDFGAPKQENSEPPSPPDSNPFKHSRSRSDISDAVSGNPPPENLTPRLRSPVSGKPPPPPKPAGPLFTPKERAPMRLLMGPPAPMAPPRKRTPKDDSSEAELISGGTGAKPKIMGRKPGTD